MATKPITKKTPKQIALTSVMKKAAAEDRARARKRAAAPKEATVPATPTKAPTKAPAKPGTTPRAAKGGKKAGKAPGKPEAAARANTGAKGGKPPARPKGMASGKPDAPKRLSAIDAAARVLADRGVEMSAREMVAAMTKRGLWSSPGGKTPDATLYSAIIREIGAKGSGSRFKKTGPGRFASSGKRR